MRYLVAAALLAAASSAAAQHYRWTDPSGRIHFTDTPPPASAKNVKKKPRLEAVDLNDTGNEPFVLQVARQNNPVRLYTAPSCGPVCDDARALLNTRGVPFTETSVSTEAAIAQLREASGATSVPVLIVGASVQRGFEAGAYQRLLDMAGYPKTGVLPRRAQGEPKEPPAPMTAEASPPSAQGPYAPRFR